MENKESWQSQAEKLQARAISMARAAIITRTGEGVCLYLEVC